MAALATALGLLLTPYALQYDYPPLVLALFWVYGAFPRGRSLQRWLALAVLVFVFSVPLWERPVYDGYWMLLGIAGLLVYLNASLWHWPMRHVSREQLSRGRR
jgi:drug/metabolite transporter (DMT)-like permease